MRLKIHTHTYRDIIIQTMVLSRYLRDCLFLTSPCSLSLYPLPLPLPLPMPKRWAANDPFTLAAHQQVVTHMETQNHTVSRVPSLHPSLLPPPPLPINMCAFPHWEIVWLKSLFLAKINSNQSAIVEKQKCIKNYSWHFCAPPSPPPLGTTSLPPRFVLVLARPLPRMGWFAFGFSNK